MGQFGRVAIEAVELIITNEKIQNPRDAWNMAAGEEISSRSSREKGCPMDAFLGLCEEGLITGIPAGTYTTSKENKEYAVKAISILRENPELANNKQKLWKEVIGEKSISENQQMDVVISLWNRNLIVQTL